jgi:tetratricopeptide (TPR) repeat protein
MLVDLPPHTNVIQIEGIVWHEGEPWIVMPTMNGSLRDLLRQHPHFTTRRLTPKTDVFSLGIILFELLAGRHPFEALTLRDIASRILNEVPSFSALERTRIPGPLRAVCTACLEKSAENRPSAAEIIGMLGSKQQYAPRERTGIGDIAYLVNRANTLTELGRAEEAQRLLDQCLAENPWYLSAVSSRAEIEYAKGNVQQAAEMAETATTIALWISPPPPGLGTLLVDLANYYLSIDPEQAIRHARLAVKLDPEDWQALGNLAEGCRVFGEARNRQDLLAEGLAAVQEALSKAPRDLKLLITYGGILLAQKDLQTLYPFVIRLVNEFGDDDVFLRLLLIRTFIAMGQLDDAERWLTPMRAYPPLQPIVEAAEQEMGQRRRDLGIA